VSEWRPDWPDEVRADPSTQVMIAAMGRKA